MQEALDDDQCSRMRTFLWALSWAAGKCYAKGVKPDVYAFMQTYSGIYGKRHTFHGMTGKRQRRNAKWGT